jgi:hypothetical protein
MSASPAAPTGRDQEPRPEYPRPQFIRQEWLNLNGRREFELDDDNSVLEERWYECRRGAFSGEHNLHGRTHHGEWRRSDRGVSRSGAFGKNIQAPLV